MDYLSFSFHKFLAPFGVGVLYAKEHLLAAGLPFLYGGDMIAEGQVFADSVTYNDLPWKYAAGTPNIGGTIVSAQALRLVVDLVAGDDRWFGADEPLPHDVVADTMADVERHLAGVSAYAMDRLLEVPGLVTYGPPPGSARTPLVAFNVAGADPVAIADGLGRLGVEARAGCHCATLAHRELRLDPLASCRLSFALYSSYEDVDRAVTAVRRVVADVR